MRTVSLYSGAGGLDLGFIKAGFNVIWANDFNKNACLTYAHNIGNHIREGDINQYLEELYQLKNVDFIMGGPPCQGFSVAGKMDPKDPRSKHVWTFTDIVEELQPKAFLMENVKALGVLNKWKPLRIALLKKFRSLGYMTNYIVLNAKDFDVPQSRERVFFIGFKGNGSIIPDLETMLELFRKPGPSVREALSDLDKAGSGNNQGTCKAKITIAPNPVLRKSPYSGMLFNGMGRPVRIDGFCNTLPASMGGNKTPIIDEYELYDNKESWVEKYHASVMKGSKPMEYQIAPKRLRRLTVQEAALIQTFPFDYEFQGSQSSTFSQIGNAVPCNLAFNIAKMIYECLQQADFENKITRLSKQLEIELNG